MLKYNIGNISLHSYCLNNNIPYRMTLIGIQERGMTIQEAINYAVENGNSKHFYKGMRFVDYCRKYGINYNKMIHRMSRKGLTIEEALQNKKRYCYIRTKSEELGINEHTVRNRLRCGKTIEEAFSIGKGKCGRPRKYFYKGKHISELFSDKNSYSRVLNTIHRTGGNVIKAVQMEKDRLKSKELGIGV